MNNPLIGIVVALPNEWKYFRAAFSHLHRRHCENLTCYVGHYGDLECVVLMGGVGRENAGVAARTLVEHYPINALVSLGYAGALSPELVRGDIVLSAHSTNGKNGSLSAWEETLEETLRLLADQSHEHHVYVSPLFTADRIVARHDDKRRIFEETGAEIVDMESASLFKVSREEGIPFIGIHSVTDTADEDIPALEVITPFLSSKSLWRYPKIFWDIATHPKFIYDIAILNHDAKTAGHTLAHFLKANQQTLCDLMRSCVKYYPKNQNLPRVTQL